MVCTMSNFELCGIYYNLQSLKSTFWGLEERQEKSMHGKKVAWSKRRTLNNISLWKSYGGK